MDARFTACTFLERLQTLECDLKLVFVGKFGRVVQHLHTQ